MTGVKHPTLGDEIVPPPPQTAGQFAVLDTLRAVGALAVLTTHTAFWAGSYTSNGIWGTVLARLDVGVAIFFVLSGFLLSRAYLARAAAGRRAPATGHYLWKRFLRIMPVYVIAVVAALSLISDNRGLGPVDWVQALLMLDTFLHPTFPEGLTHMWSLAVEVTFYLVLPLLMLLGTGRRRLRPRRVALLLGVLCAVSVWWQLDGGSRLGAESGGSPVRWLPAYLTWFAIGIGLALVHLLYDEATREGRTPGRLLSTVAAAGRQPGSCWAVAVGVLLVSATPVAGPTMLAAPTPAESLTKNLLYAAIGGLLVTSGVFADRRGGYVRIFGHVRLRRLGWISYSIFCLHLPLLHFVMWATGWPLFQGRGLQIWALTLVLTLVVSEVTYRLVELPALRLKALRVGSRHPTDERAATRGTSIR